MIALSPLRGFIHTLILPIKAISLIAIGLLTTSCATMIHHSNPKINKSVMLTGAMPPQGVVLKSSQPLFLHSSNKTVHTRGSGVEYTSGGSQSKTELITDVRASNSAYATSNNTQIQLKPSPNGQMSNLSVYCNCSLEESKKRDGAGQALLEPACDRKANKKPQTVTLRTETNTLWLILGIVPGLGIGYFVDHLTGYLYDYQSINIASACKRKKR